MHKFGERVRDLRNAAQLTQGDLAQRIGVSQGQLSKIETGTASLQPEAIRALLPRLTGSLGTTLWGLVGGTECAEHAAGDCLVSVSGDEGIRWLAYFASALTGLTEAQKDALSVATVRGACESHRTFLYEPSQYTDPVRHPDISAERVYVIDRAQVSESDIVILHCDHPSFGAGQELEIAASAGIPVLLLARKGGRISRMVLGSYARTKLVEFEQDADLGVALNEALGIVFNDLSLRVQLQASDIGGRVRRLREERSIQRYALAQAVGLSEAAISDLETGSAQRVNPSFATIRRTATFLKTTVSYLIDGVIPRPEDVDPVLARSKESLNRFALSSVLSHAETERLWGGFVLEYQAQRRAVAEARTEALSEDDWCRRRAGSASKGQTFLGLDAEE